MKKVICILLSCLLVLSITACGQKAVTKRPEILPMEISQEDWDGYRKFVELPTGVKMAYVEMGDPEGEVVILQHGMTDNSRSWSLAAPYFCQAGYHVYLPDLRGMGKSSAPDGYYTPITYATDMNAFFDAMGIQKAIVVGHSLGSFTAQAFSIMFPEKVEKMVLVSSSPLKQYQNDGLVYAYLKYIDPLPKGGYPTDTFIDVWYATELHEEEFSNVFDTFLGYMKKEAQALPKESWKSIIYGLTIDTFTNIYSQVDKSIPVLVLHGDADTMAEKQYQQELCDIFNVPESSYINYDGIGHNIQFEMPHKCATDILTWLDSI